MRKRRRQASARPKRCGRMKRPFRAPAGALHGGRCKNAPNDDPLSISHQVDDFSRQTAILRGSRSAPIMTQSRDEKIPESQQVKPNWPRGHCSGPFHRQVLRDRTPLASRAQNIHDPVHHFAYIDAALVAAALGWRDQQFDVRPFIVRQITRISQFAAVVPPAIFRRPHPCPRIRPPLLNPQTIQMTQDDFGQTLRDVPGTGSPASGA
jgi:hypothetical protein